MWHLAPPEFAGTVPCEPLPVYVCVFPRYPMVYDVPLVFPVVEVEPYELLINVGSATSWAIFLALWKMVHAFRAVAAEINPSPKLILMFHKLHSNAKPCHFPPICDAQDVPWLLVIASDPVLLWAWILVYEDDTVTVPKLWNAADLIEVSDHHCLALASWAPVLIKTLSIITGWR